MLLPGLNAREIADWLTPIRAASWREVSGLTASWSRLNNGAIPLHAPPRAVDRPTRAAGPAASNCEYECTVRRGEGHS